jgi:hypothetical protein
MNRLGGGGHYRLPHLTPLADGMSISRPVCTSRTALALAAAIWSQSCVVHRPTPGDVHLRQGTELRIHSAGPLTLTRQTDTLPATPVCCVTSVEGRFVRVSGDTLVVERGSGIAVTSGLSRIPTPREFLTVVRTPETEVTVRQIDRARTTALLLGITAAIIGLLALGASQIEYGLPSGGGTY